MNISGRFPVSGVEIRSVEGLEISENKKRNH